MEKSKSSSELAYDKIKYLITSGQLEPREKVSQSKIANAIGISTVPVVEAMRLLESEGLLVKDGRKMARVRSLSQKEIEGLYLVREGLESIAARLCARRISQEQVDHLKSLLVRFEEAVDKKDEESFNNLEVQIHQCIVKNADCSLLSDELNRALLIEKTAAERRQIKDLQKYRKSHRALIESIIDRDEELAEYLMKRHIKKGLVEYLEIDK